ncbi:MAG: tRNA dihydrouridine(20/20a) synthase DusA [Acidobacteriota bacterium]
MSPSASHPRTSARRGGAYPLSIAPMMDHSDRHFRWIQRQLARRPLVYTEMVTTGALLNGDRERFLAFDPAEHPLALQLGGDDPKELATCARMAADAGFDEVNLNVGCPSDRVQKGRFGVCLMARPERVAEAVAAMRSVVGLPVTVKHRIGFDDLDRYEDMRRFVDRVAEAGCDRFAVHARKAWLQGLNPKQNREIPPLRYSEVYRLKEERPDLQIEINGGIRTLDDARVHLGRVDGVMVGRVAYEDPFALAGADGLWGEEDHRAPSRREVVVATADYLRRWQGKIPPARILRHLLGLFAGQPGARAWRRTLSEGMHRPEVSGALLDVALAQIPAEILDERPTAANSKAAKTNEAAAVCVDSSQAV